jgi:hypothetical protein
MRNWRPLLERIALAAGSILLSLGLVYLAHLVATAG